MDWSSCLIDGVPTLKCLEILYVNILRSLGGVVFLILLGVFAYGSIKWITAGDDPAKLKTAKGTFFSAVLGMAIIASAYLVLNILSSVFGINLTIFQVPT